MTESQVVASGGKLNHQNCKSCPFIKSADALELSSEKWAEIYHYLLGGMNHFCHSDRSNKTVCKGGRDWQLQQWYRIGIISEPTNEALVSEMIKRGIIPRSHIN
jgi:hypothetical protein